MTVCNPKGIVFRDFYPLFIVVYTHLVPHLHTVCTLLSLIHSVNDTFYCKICTRTVYRKCLYTAMPQIAIFFAKRLVSKYLVSLCPFGNFELLLIQLELRASAVAEFGLKRQRHKFFGTSFFLLQNLFLGLQ